ncbi:MAG: endonuclease/exonuclease/phosphatase family protein [Lachnospiraceae bacterium]
MRIFSLNLNSFDGTKNRFNTKIKRDDICLRKDRAKKIAEYIMNEKHKIDIAIFQEVDCLEGMCDFYVSIFEQAGYKKIKLEILKKNTKFCNLIVAKSNPDIEVDPVKNDFSIIRLNRWLEVTINDKNATRKVNLLNFHRKDASDVYALLKYFKNRQDRDSIVIGDFNAARNDHRDIQHKDSYIVYENTEFLNLFESLGYNEKGDKKFTFYNKEDKSDGRRIDHCFVSGDISDCCECYTDESLNGLTDHLAIVLDIE